MYKKILVPLDGSESSEEVLTLVRMLADAGNSEIILLRVIEYPLTMYPPDYKFPTFDPDIQKTITQKKQDYSHEVGSYLERIVSAMRNAGIRAAAEVCDGPVVDSILECVNRLGIDLVILSTYGQSGGEEGTIGAVANRVLREAQVPVVLARPAAVSHTSPEFRVPSQTAQFAGMDGKPLKKSRHHSGSKHLPTGA